MVPPDPLVVIVGPTAAGKTALAIRLAQSLDGEIVSADSRQIYRGLDIGTAKPNRIERSLVPHHLIDVADPLEPWSLVDYKAAALEAIRDIQARRRLPFLVGGTGQYIWAVLEGWAPPPRAEDDRFRRRLEVYGAEHGSEALHRRLEQVDPERAAAIDPRNVRRVIRALEIFALTGVPPSRMRVRRPPPFASLILGLTRPRSELFSRIDARIDTMLEAGWVEETRSLMDQGLKPDSPTLSAIGYREIVMYLRGEKSLEEAIEEVRRKTKQFVRRQRTWFKFDDPRIEWYEVHPGVEEELAERVRGWLTEGRFSQRGTVPGSEAGNHVG